MEAFLHPTLPGYLITIVIITCLVAVLIRNLGAAIGISIIGSVIYGAILVFASTALIPIVSFVKLHPLLIAGFIAAYTFTGVVIALFKWKGFSRDEPYRIFNWHYSSPDKFTEDEKIIKLYELIPKAGDNKSKIAKWISYWPYHLLEFMFNDMFRKFFRYVTELCEGLFNKVSISQNKELVEKYKQIKSVTVIKKD